MKGIAYVYRLVGSGRASQDLGHFHRVGDGWGGDGVRAYRAVVGTCIAIYPEPASCATAREQQTLLMDRFWPVTILCLLVALFLQIAVNYANDYSDGIRGTDAGRDTDESKSGKPQRLTASGLVPAKHVLFAAMICAAIACICGVVAVVLAQAWWLLAVGAASLLAGSFYTGGKHPYGYVGLGEVGVFLFFGLAAVLGTDYALCGTGGRRRTIGCCGGWPVLLPDHDGEQYP